MHRLTMMAGALGVALLTGTGAFAQVPARSGQSERSHTGCV